nr:photosystem I reaction center subunit III, chloroplastic [Ipomoea batatas]
MRESRCSEGWNSWSQLGGLASGPPPPGPLPIGSEAHPVAAAEMIWLRHNHKSDPALWRSPRIPCCSPHLPSVPPAAPVTPVLVVRSFEAFLRRPWRSSSVLLSTPRAPGLAEHLGLTPCKESKQCFAKRRSQADLRSSKPPFKKLRPAAPLPRSQGNHRENQAQRHWGEFITPVILFLTLRVDRWSGGAYLNRPSGDEKKPTQKESHHRVPLANRLVWRGSSGPLPAYREYVTGEAHWTLMSKIPRSSFRTKVVARRSFDFVL